MPRRLRNDQLPMIGRRRPHHHDQSAVRAARELTDAALNLAGLANRDRTQLHSELLARGWDDGPWSDAGGGGGFSEDRRAPDSGRDLLEQLRPFPGQTVF